LEEKKIAALATKRGSIKTITYNLIPSMTNIVLHVDDGEYGHHSFLKQGIIPLKSVKTAQSLTLELTLKMEYRALKELQMYHRTEYPTEW
jgi:hypothetical protein